MIERVAVLVLAVAATVWAFRNWREGLRAVLVLLVFEGALRKWVFPGAADFLYFFKDLLLLGVYGGYLRRRNKHALRPAVPGLVAGTLGAAAVFGVIQILNPNLPNLLVGILGWKAYFLYVPLLWVVPAAFRDDRDLYQFLRRYLLLAIPVGLLAAAQFVSPPGSWINTYAPRGGGSVVAGAGGIVTFGSSAQVRVTGTFSFISGFTTYLLVAALLALAFLALGRWRFKGNLWVYAALAMVLGSILMTGSRGPFILLAVLFPLYWVLGVAREGGIPALGRFLLGAGVVLALVNFVGADAVEAFVGRARGGQDVLGRIVQPFVTPFQLAGEVGFLGFGIGASHQTAEAVTKGVAPYSWLRGLHQEAEPSKIMLELGILGWFLIFLARIGLVVAGLRAVFRLHSSFHRVVATSCALLFLAHTMGGVVFNVTGGVLYWFFGGLLMLVRRLDREQAIARWMAQRATLAAPPAPSGRELVRPAVAR